AVFLLKDAGVDRLDVVSYVSHGVSKLVGSDPHSPAQTQQQQYQEQQEEEEGASLTGNPLEDFRTDLTAQAKKGELDVPVGRAKWLHRCVEIRCRRRKDCPLVVGESGDGKPALAAGLARRIIAGLVPVALRNAELYLLDMGSLLAGTRYRGDFEDRRKA